MISPFKEGATVIVAQGVLRGVGPMGPHGPRGYPGEKGEKGDPGIPAPFEPVAGMYTTSAGDSIPADGNWKRVPLTTTSYRVNPDWSFLVTAGDSVGMVRVTKGSALGIHLIATLDFTVVRGAAENSAFQIEAGLFNGSSATPFAVQTFTHNNGASSSRFTLTGQQLYSADGGHVGIGFRLIGASAAATVNFASLGVANTGGSVGPQGQQGLAGPQGNDGPQGPPGNSGTGYATIDAIAGAFGDSDAEPAGTTYSPQGYPVALGTQLPALAWFITKIGDVAGRRSIRRFASSTEMASAVDSEVGQVAFLQSNNSLQVMTSINGTPTPATVAQVSYGTTAPPDGTYPAGTVYFQVTG